jgi:uncharacterized protein with PIN domain
MIRFATDRTLGKLARWLRLLGFDTVFENEIEGNRFLKRIRPGTILLTRTRKVKEALGASQRFVFIESNDTREQLRQVVDELGIEMQDTRPFSRCLKCNVVIEEIDKDQICGQVPDYIWENNTIFQYCPECNKIYWPVSHTERSLERIREIFS